MDNQKIGFFSLYETESIDSYVGALLITNEFGIPIEFKCTQSVKPTPIQKSLYGEKLKPFIAINLCGVPLLNNISNKPEIIFINIPDFISLRTEINTATILIRRAGDFNNLQSVNSNTENERIENTSGQFQALVLQAHPNFKEDLSKYSDITKQLFENFDVAEPFDRMKISIDILGKNDSKFK